MPNLAQPPDNTADAYLAGFAVHAAYYRYRVELYRWVYAHAAVERGLPPAPLS
jgi:hypothetical protein